MTAWRFVIAFFLLDIAEYSATYKITGFSIIHSRI